MRSATLASVCILFALFAQLARAEIVYSQSPSADPDSVGLGWFSSSEPRPTRNFKHADNFVLSESAEIVGVNWWGLTEGLNDTTLENFDSFTIEFWSSETLSNGRIKPDELLMSETLTLASSNASQTGRAALNGALEYQHAYELAESISLDAGNEYWISISARSIDPAGDVWQWQDAELADTISSSFDYALDRWRYFEDSDSAFELVRVPAPSSAMALLIVGVMRKRRR